MCETRFLQTGMLKKFGSFSDTNPKDDINIIFDKDDIEYAGKRQMLRERERRIITLKNL